jgi:nucleoside-diphosphate-sugar epimerase
LKILVTGNMGYIGPLVMERFRATRPGATLVGLDTGYFADCITNAPFLPETRIDIQYFADIRNFPPEVLDRVDAVVHLAAISNDPMGNTFSEATYDINHQAGVRLAQESKTRGVKWFVFASSCSMYGSADDAPRKEDSPFNPLTAYAKSKVYTEADLQGMADRNFLVTSLRFSTACGMSERLRLDLVLNDFVACALTTRQITVLSDGTPWRPLINVRDMARAIDWAVGREEAAGGTFLAVNVGSNAWNYQVKDLAQAVAAAIPGVTISINENALPDKRSYRVHFDLFRELAPNHQPEFDLAMTIRELEEGLSAMGFKDGDFRNSRFMRLKVLAELRERGLLSERLEWRRPS